MFESPQAIVSDLLCGAIWSENNRGINGSHGQRFVAENKPDWRLTNDEKKLTVHFNRNNIWQIYWMKMWLQCVISAPNAQIKWATHEWRYVLNANIPVTAITNLLQAMILVCLVCRTNQENIRQYCTVLLEPSAAVSVRSSKFSGKKTQRLSEAKNSAGYDWSVVSLKKRHVPITAAFSIVCVNFCNSSWWLFRIYTVPAWCVVMRRSENIIARAGALRDTGLKAIDARNVWWLSWLLWISEWRWAESRIDTSGVGIVLRQSIRVTVAS